MRSVRVVTAVVVAAVLSLALAGLTALRVDTQPEAFLPAEDPSLGELESASRAFGADPIVVLAESGEAGRLLGPEQLPLVLKFEGQLAKLPDVAVVYGPATVLNELAISSNKMLVGLFAQRDAARRDAERQARDGGATPAAVTAAGDTAIAAFDERYAPLLVQGLPAGLPTLRNPAFVRNLVFADEGGQLTPRAQWRFMVPEANAIAILVRPREKLDQEATDRLVEAVRATARDAGLVTESLTVTGAPAVAASLADQVRREIPLLGGLAVGLIAVCYLAVPWLGRRRHRLLPIAATLVGTGLTLAVFGWSGRPLSLGAMAFLPILIGIGSDFPAYLVQGGRCRPILVAALASAVGFGSLAVSPLPFVRDLGLALALGVLLAAAIGMGLRRWLVDGPPRNTDTEDTAGGGGDGEAPVGLAPGPAASGGPGVAARLPVAARLGLAGMALAIAAVGWVALPRLALEASPDRLAEGMPAIADARHAEQVLGSSGELRVLLSGPENGTVLTPEALNWMRRAQDEVVVRHGDQLRPILGLPDLLRFLGPAPTQDELDSAVALLPGYVVSAVTTPDARQAVLGFGIELQDLGGQQRLIAELRRDLPPAPPGFEVGVAGLPVVAARGYELVSGNRYLPNLVGIVAAGLVLLVGLRRRLDAALAVAAAAVATGWGLAAVLLLGIPLTPLTVALGSLTTATACEFTVLLSGVGAVEAGATRRRAAYRRTVAVAALAAAVGYATLAVSELAVIREFGLLLSLTVLLSLGAAHLVVALAPRPRPAGKPIATPRTAVTV